MTKLPFTFTDKSLSVFIRGSLQTIPESHPGFKKLVAHLGDPKLADHDELYIAELLDKRELVSRMTSGLVVVVGNDVYFRGVPVRSSLTEKLLSMLDNGFDAGPWAKFLDNLMANPSERSKECLYNFLERYATPLTPDGCFVAFKYVREDYKDAYSGTFDNSPGKYVSMPRESVNPNPNETCSSGLHVCASPYLDEYTAANRIIAVKVNPKDVVAVPTDYGYSKMRVCAYEVMGDAEGGHEIKAVETKQVVYDQGHATRSEHKIPDELVGLPHVLNARDFYQHYDDDQDSDPMVGDMVRTLDGYTVGILTRITEGESQPEEYYDEDLEEYVKDYDSVFSYDVYHVTWQNGIETLEYDYSGSYNDVLYLVHKLDKYDNPTDKETVFKHEATNTVISATDLKNIVSEMGQRAYSRQSGIPRSTLQGWLASI